MRILAYLRVSTEQQAESGAGIDAQRNACMDWASKQGAAIAEFYCDEGVSGSTGLDERPALMDALSLLKKGDVLLVAKRDRLGRDPIAVALIEASVNRKHGKVVSAAGEGTDDNEPCSILMRRMIDAFAEFERNTIGKRTSAAMQAKKKKGERVGHIPFGFRLAEDEDHIEKDEVEQAILGQIRELVRQGFSTREIASELNRRGVFNRGNKWNHGSVHRIMTKIAA